jgi:hypothetical protein
VLVTGYLSEPDMRGLMCATDLNVALRFPSVGETSGTLTRALGLGVPSVVLDYEAFSEFAAEHVTKLPLISDVAGRLGEVMVDFCADRQNYADRAAVAQRWVIKHASLERSIAGLVEAVQTVAGETLRSSNLYRDLAGDLLSCIESSLKRIRLHQPVATPEDLSERIGDALLTDETAVVIVKACRAEYVSLVVDPHRDKPSQGRSALHQEEPGNVRVRKAVLVVSSLDLRTCNIDYVVEELGIERFDVLLLVLLPLTLMGPRVLPCDGSARLPAYLRERGRESASFRVSARSLTYIKFPSIRLSSEQIEVPVQIIACEALI